MAGKTAILSLRILADAKEAQKALDDTASSADKFGSGVGKAAVPAAAALAGLAAAGISAAKAAAEDQASADQLAVALKNSTGATDKQVASTEKWITKTSKSAAVADDELRPALATLARATGDTEESQKAMGVALDVSAATGKDVESVSNALAKAYAGNTASLGKLVPGMDKAVLASGDMDAIMGELARTTGGAAATAANSAAGKWKGFQIQMGEAQESIGGALLPAMTSLGSKLQGMAGWVQDNTTAFLIIAGVIGTVAAAIVILNVAIKAYVVITKAWSAATKIATVVQKAFNSSFLSNPIFLVIAAIVVLVVAIVMLWQKNEGFRNAIIGAWNAIASAAAAVWNWIVSVLTTAWNAILAAGRAAIAWLVGIWDSLKAAVAAVWDWIVSAITAVWDIIVAIASAYIAVYVAIWNGLVAGVQAVWDWIVDLITAVWNIIVGIVQGYIAILVAIWDALKAGVEAVWAWIRSAVDTAMSIIKGIVQRYVDNIVWIWEGIKDAVGKVWDWLKETATDALDAILTPVNAVKDAFDRVVDAIRKVIDWLGKIKIPDVLSSIGDVIGGLFSAPAATSSGGGVSTFGATSAPMGARAFGAAPTLSAAAGAHAGGTTVIVQGALDPVAVARQIRQILTTDDRRRTGVVIA